MMSLEMNWTLMFRLVSLFVWLFFICPHTDLVTVPPTESKPIHKLYISARGQSDTTVVKKFQHILGLCSSSKRRKLENRYHASNLCMKRGIFHWSEIDTVVKLLVTTLTYHNLIY